MSDLDLFWVIRGLVLSLSTLAAQGMQSTASCLGTRLHMVWGSFYFPDSLDLDPCGRLSLNKARTVVSPGITLQGRPLTLF